MTVTRRAHLKALAGMMGLTGAGMATAADSPFYGTWTAVFDPGKVPLRLRLVVDAHGVMLHLNSVNQGDASFPGSELALDGEQIKVSFKRLNVKIEGVLRDGRSIDAVFTQDEPLNLRFSRGEVAETVSEAVWPALTRDVLEEKRSAAGAPAMGAAWARGDRSGLLVAGLRSSESKIAVRSEDQWHLGSITKSMTATLCARLVEAGLLSWDTTVGQVLDREGAAVAQSYRNATLVHLLSHRAGLQPDVEEADAKAFSAHLQDARAERLRYAQLALMQKPVAALGARHAYSNNGYVVVGAMLEKLTGKSWETLIQGEVFAPLGLKRAGHGAPGTPGLNDQPMGHVVLEGHRRPRPPGGPDDDNIAAMGPAGAVHMPLADILVYLTAHRDRPARYLRAASWDKLHTPPFGGHDALGWFTNKDGRLWHSGSNTLWMAQVLVDQKAGLVCASCANDASARTSRIVEEVLASARAAALS